MESTIDFTQILNSTKIIALRYVKNQDIAEEIAQMAAIQYHLNSEKIIFKARNSWIYSVTHNLCMDYFRKIAKDRQLCKDSEFYNQLCTLEEDAKSNFKIDFDSYDFIKKEDKLFLKKYYEHGDYTKLAQGYKKKVKYIKDKIYRLEQEIKLFHIFNSQIIQFDPIPGTKLTTNMHNFMKRLKESMIINDFSSLSRYLENCQVNPEVSKLNIVEFLISKIAILGNKRYQLTIGYSDGGELPKFFLLIFTITETNSIKILEFPIIPASVLKVHDKYLDPKEKSKTIIGSRGNYNQKYGSYDEMKKSNIGIEIQTKSDFE